MFSSVCLNEYDTLSYVSEFCGCESNLCVNLLWLCVFVGMISGWTFTVFCFYLCFHVIFNIFPVFFLFTIYCLWLKFVFYGWILIYNTNSTCRKIKKTLFQPGIFWFKSSFCRKFTWLKKSSELFNPVEIPSKKEFYRVDTNKFNWLKILR